MRVVLVTSTRRGAGKTTVAAGLVEALSTRGAAAVGYKPLDVGCPYTKDHDLRSPDQERLGRLGVGPAVALDGLGVRVREDLPPVAIPARLGLELGLEELVDLGRDPAFTHLVVEGYGGVAEPLTSSGEDVLDLARRLGAFVVLVVPEDREALAQATLALRDAAARGARVDQVIGAPVEAARSGYVEAAIEVLAARLGPRWLRLPRLEPGASASTHLAGLVDRILAH